MNDVAGWTVFEHVAIAFLAALPPTIMATAALIAALRAYRQSRETARRIDGRVDQLVQEARDRARLEGVLEGQADVLGAPLPVRPQTRVERGYPSGPHPDLPPPAAPADRPRRADP